MFVRMGGDSGKIQNTDDLIRFLDNVTDKTTVQELEDAGIQAFFRGTTRSVDGSISPGNATSIRFEATSTSTNPIVATIFAIENVTANSSRKGIIEIAIPSQLKHLKLYGPNSRYDKEFEIIFNIKPESYSNLVNLEINVDDAMRIIRDLYGIELPKRINSINEANQIVDNTLKLDLSQSERFYNEAIKYNKKK